MSATAGPTGRRPWWFFLRSSRAGGDPDGGWATEALAPLRRQRVECDIAPRVMARIDAEARALRAAAAAPRVSRLAWASSLLLACAALSFVGVALVLLVRGGDEGVAELAGLAQSGWHVLAVLGRVLSEAGSRCVAPVLPFLRAAWALADVFVPLLRGAGLLAAAAGTLSILFSTYVFASARKTAPRVNYQGGTR